MLPWGEINLISREFLGCRLWRSTIYSDPIHHSPIMNSLLPPELISRIIRYAWEDRTSFEEIKERTGFTESQVIQLMRRELKPSSFRMWRKRVGGRVTKHRRLLEQYLHGPSAEE
jgi:uncharacterized protein (TIGR03643 family)